MTDSTFRRFAERALLAGTLVICVATSAPPPVPPPNVPMWSIASAPLVLPCGTADVWVAKSGKAGVGITVRITPTPKPSGQSAGLPPAVDWSPTGMPQPPDSEPVQGSTKPAQVATSPDSAPGAPPTDDAGPTRATSTGCDATVAAKLRFADRVFEGVLVVSKRGNEMTREELMRNPDEHQQRGVRPDPGSLEGTYHYLGFELDNEERWNHGERTATFELDIYIDGNKQSWTLPATHAYREFPARRRW